MDTTKLRAAIDLTSIAVLAIEAADASVPKGTRKAPRPEVAQAKAVLTILSRLVDDLAPLSSPVKKAKKKTVSKKAGLSDPLLS